eukprot:1390339-Prymnesium_polylepis.1
MRGMGTELLVEPPPRFVGRLFGKCCLPPCSQVMPKWKAERALLEEQYDIDKLLWYRGPPGA